MKKKGVNEYKVALSNLKDAKFFPKKIKSGKKLVDRSKKLGTRNARNKSKFLKREFDERV